MNVIESIILLFAVTQDSQTVYVYFECCGNLLDI